MVFVFRHCFPWVYNDIYNLIINIKSFIVIKHCLKGKQQKTYEIFSNVVMHSL